MKFPQIVQPLPLHLQAHVHQSQYRIRKERMGKQILSIKNSVNIGCL